MSLCQMGFTIWVMQEKWACFTCRKMFKHFPVPFIINGKRRPRKCPQCQGDMFHMSKFFKPPKTSHKKSWKRLEVWRKAAEASKAGEASHG